MYLKKWGQGGIAPLRGSGAVPHGLNYGKGGQMSIAPLFYYHKSHQPTYIYTIKTPTTHNPKKPKKTGSRGQLPPCGEVGQRPTVLIISNCAMPYGLEKEVKFMTVRVSDIPKQFLKYTQINEDEQTDTMNYQNKKRTASDSEAALFVLLVLLFLYQD